MPITKHNSDHIRGKGNHSNGVEQRLDPRGGATRTAMRRRVSARAASFPQDKADQSVPFERNPTSGSKQSSANLTLHQDCRRSRSLSQSTTCLETYQMSHLKSGCSRARHVETSSPAVSRALDMLEVISESNSGLTNAYLARRLGIPKSSACSILRVLQNRGYLCRYDDNGRYKLGFKLLKLERKLVENSAFRDLALPFMRDLVDWADLTCHLAILGQSEAVHLEKIITRRHFKQDRTRSVGEPVPLHSSSVGKALLAWQEAPILQARLLSMELRRSTARTITTSGQMLIELNKVRSQGYAVDNEEYRIGWRCVGAPIFDEFSNTRAAICLTGTVTEVDDSRLTSLALAVMETAHKISQRLSVKHVHFAT